jgi:hypothetical protein
VAVCREIDVALCKPAVCREVGLAVCRERDLAVCRGGWWEAVCRDEKQEGGWWVAVCRVSDLAVCREMESMCRGSETSAEHGPLYDRRYLRRMNL